MNNRAAGAAVGVDIALSIIFGSREKGEPFHSGYRAAYGSTGINIVIGRTRKPIEVGKPVVRVQLVGSRVGVQRTVVVRSASLGSTGNDHGTVRLICAEVGRLHLHFADERVVDVLKVRAEVSRVGQVGAIQL